MLFFVRPRKKDFLKAVRTVTVPKVHGKREKVNNGATHPCHAAGASPMQVIYHMLKLQCGSCPVYFYWTWMCLKLSNVCKSLQNQGLASPKDFCGFVLQL